jgi:hypothetical protein
MPMRDAVKVQGVEWRREDVRWGRSFGELAEKMGLGVGGLSV